ncbi:thioredoxin [Streptomyces malaysiensis]|uniref:Thioredoxin n=1 Tax=Streptomyces malaysiensis subsp. samsunensis TaxID=459658 RepID=A0A9X2LUR0_STRMQ|nr:thioredoxin [Streptomyces samsunensis]MCQ8830326.1 thioredoxin [Streptomyces samsunensis]WPB90646.1 thioredoxin [Streptomyces malaysiensis]
MSTIELTADNFDEVISGNDFVIIDFWAEWCGPCRKFGPVFERVSETIEDVIFAKVDTEAQRELAQAFEITSIPTLMIVREQIAVFRQPGALPEAALTGLIRRAQDLDMDEVRAQSNAPSNEQ